MMKRFCDICGEECEYRVGTRTSAPANDSWVTNPPVANNFITATISAAVIFSWHGRADGFGGPPDLCDKCVGNFIMALYQHITKEPQPCQQATDTEAK